MRCQSYPGFLTLLAVSLLSPHLVANDAPIYERDVAPLLTKYCAGCHNAQEAEGEAKLDSLAGLLGGSENGTLIEKGNADASRLIQLINGKLEPSMPPEDEPAPTEEEVQILRSWIEGGLKSDPKYAKMGLKPVLPNLAAAPESFHFVSSAVASQDELLLGKLGRVEAWPRGASTPSWTNPEASGKVNAIRLSSSGKIIGVGAGQPGVAGETLLLDHQGNTTQVLRGHQDAVYCLAISPDESLIATGSYDHSIILWDVASGKQVRSFAGHNGAIYDLDFDPSGQVLASASADQTVKLWNVQTGQRLDTLGQPEGEMYCVRFSPDGNYVFAAGADKQIRKWKLTSRVKPSINPLVIARYAAESDILQIACTENQLISTSSDRTVKSWSIQELQPLGTLCALEDDPVSLSVISAEEGLAIEIRGAQRMFKLAAMRDASEPSAQPQAIVGSDGATAVSQEIAQVEESEPNDTFSHAAKIDVPATVTGTIFSAESGPAIADTDLFRFTAQAGEKWIIEAKSEGKDSKLDSFVDVLNEFGEPVVRCRLQALRATYFTFRGKDSATSDDFRLHRWEDMELDEYLYSNGEVNRLWLYPRGPDSGFKVYPGFGSRYTYFGTTALSHALGEPAYIVRELAPQEQPLPNGLPVFTIYYENDDDSLRRSGKNARLTFVAPQDGDYFVRLRDARGFESEQFSYRLTLRRPAPDFEVKLSAKPMKMPVGSGRELKVEAKRLDGFDGPISIAIQNLPDHLQATNPIIIEAGQQTALGTIFAQDAGQGTSAEETKPLEFSLTASATINGQAIVRELPDKLTVELTESREEISLELVSVQTGEPIEEIEIQPGQTVSAKLIVNRNGEKRRIGFGKEDAGRNLPHGAFVDNIGLNGLLIPEQQTEREFFITAAPKVKPGRRQFHLRSDTKNNPTSRPIWLNVVSPSMTTEAVAN